MTGKERRVPTLATASWSRTSDTGAPAYAAPASARARAMSILGLVLGVAALIFATAGWASGETWTGPVFGMAFAALAFAAWTLTRMRGVRR